MENQVQAGVAHHHEHHHEHAHHSNRSGHNRITSSQKTRKRIADTLFTFLSIIATLIVLIILYDKWKGLF